MQACRRGALGVSGCNGAQNGSAFDASSCRDRRLDRFVRGAQPAGVIDGDDRLTGDRAREHDRARSRGENRLARHPRRGRRRGAREASCAPERSNGRTTAGAVATASRTVVGSSWQPAWQPARSPSRGPARASARPPPDLPSRPDTTRGTAPRTPAPVRTSSKSFAEPTRRNRAVGCRGADWMEEIPVHRFRALQVPRCQCCRNAPDRRVRPVAAHAVHLSGGPVHAQSTSRARAQNRLSAGPAFVQVRHGRAPGQELPILRQPAHERRGTQPWLL